MKRNLTLAIEQLKRDTLYLQNVSKNGIARKDYGISQKMPPPVPPHQIRDVVIWAYDGSIISEIPHTRDFFVLQYIYKGYVYENINGQLLLLAEGDTLLVQPSVNHCISRHNLATSVEDTCIIYFALEKDLCLKSYLPYIPEDTDMLKFFINPFSINNVGQYMVVKAKDNESIKHIIEIILMEYTNMGKYYARVMDGLFVTLISLLTRNCQIMETPMQQTNVTSQILNYIHSNCAGVTLQQTADKFSYHPNYLCVLLRKSTGKNFTALVRDARMEKACILISNSDMPINEIAMLVGYSNISYFYRVFRDKYHIMPSEFRKKNLGGYMRLSEMDDSNDPSDDGDD